MSVILITGPIASGKSLIGKALAHRLNVMGQATVFMDLDEEVLKDHGSFDWDNDGDRRADWLQARQIVAENANMIIAEDQNVVVSGPFYVQDEIVGVTGHLNDKAQVFLYILEAPLALRLERNRRRANASSDGQIIDQDAAIQALPMVYGAAIQNTGRKNDAVKLLLHNLKDGVGQIAQYL